MTNTQYYISIGVPFFTILLVWLGTSVSNRNNMDAVRASIDALAVSLRAEMKLGFDAVNQRFDAVNQRIDAVEKRLGRLETIVDRIEGEIRIDHERRITVLKGRLLSRAG